MNHLGTFYDLKGMIAFLKIFKMKRSDALFWIVTNSPYKQIQVLIQKFQLNSSDCAVNSFKYREIPFVLTNTNVSIMFYRRRLSGIGCSPIKFAESLAWGVPVIINSGIGNTREIIKKERVGIVVDNFSDITFQKLSHELIHFFIRRRRIALQMQKKAEKYFSLNKRNRAISKDLPKTQSWLERIIVIFLRHAY